MLAPALLFTLTLSSSVPTASQTRQFKVVVHPDNPVTSISRHLLSRIFLKQSDHWDNGERSLPVNLAPDSTVRDAFSRTIHGRSAARINSYWQQQIYSGAGVPPSQRSSEEELLDFVRSNRGAVGYVSASSQTRGVKVIAVVEGNGQS